MSVHRSLLHQFEAAFTIIRSTSHFEMLPRRRVQATRREMIEIFAHFLPPFVTWGRRPRPAFRPRGICRRLPRRIFATGTVSLLATFARLVLSFCALAFALFVGFVA